MMDGPGETLPAVGVIVCLDDGGSRAEVIERLRRFEEPLRKKVNTHLRAALRIACGGEVDDLAAKALTPESLCTAVHDRRKRKGTWPLLDLFEAIKEWERSGRKGPPPVIRRMVKEWHEQRLATLRPGPKGGLIPSNKGISIVPNLALVPAERAAIAVARGTLPPLEDTLPGMPLAPDGYLKPGYELDDPKLLAAPLAPRLWAVKMAVWAGALTGKGRGAPVTAALTVAFMMRTPLGPPDIFNMRKGFWPVRIRDECEFRNGEQSIERELYPDGWEERKMRGVPGQWKDPANPPGFQKLRSALHIVRQTLTPLPGQDLGVRLIDCGVPNYESRWMPVSVFDLGTGPRGVGLSRELLRRYRLESGPLYTGYIGARYLLGWHDHEGRRRYPRGLEHIGRDGITPGMLALQLGRDFRNDGSRHDTDQIRAAMKTLLALAGDGVVHFETEGTRRNARIHLRELTQAELEKQDAAEARVRAKPPKTGLREAIRRARRKAAGMPEIYRGLGL